jgi:hypothetical protein
MSVKQRPPLLPHLPFARLKRGMQPLMLEPGLLHIFLFDDDRTFRYECRNGANRGQLW